MDWYFVKQVKFVSEGFGEGIAEMRENSNSPIWVFTKTPEF
mgnify:FL=1